MKESSGAQRRDKIEGRPVTDLMAARLSIPGFRAGTDNSVMRLHSACTDGKNVPLNFNLSGPFIWPPPLPPCSNSIFAYENSDARCR